MHLLLFLTILHNVHGHKVALFDTGTADKSTISAIKTKMLLPFGENSITREEHCFFQSIRTTHRDVSGQKHGLLSTYFKRSISLDFE